MKYAGKKYKYPRGTVYFVAFIAHDVSYHRAGKLVRVSYTEGEMLLSNLSKSFYDINEMGRYVIINLFLEKNPYESKK